MLTKKERCHQLSLILLKSVREKGREVETMSKMMVVFTITEVSYLVVRLFNG